MMEVTTTVFGEGRIRALMAAAPVAFLGRIRQWLSREDKSFIGTTWRSIMRKAHSDRPGFWSARVAHMFKGYVSNWNQLQGMTLRMGAGLAHPTPFTEGISEFEEGFEHSGKSGNMIIPNLRGIMSTREFFRPGQDFNESVPHSMFKTMMDQNLLFIVKRGGKVLYFSKGKGSLGQLMFVGQPSIHVDKEINFTESWERRLPAVIERGQKAADQAVADLAAKEF